MTKPKQKVSVEIKASVTPFQSVHKIILKNMCDFANRCDLLECFSKIASQKQKIFSRCFCVLISSCLNYFENLMPTSDKHLYQVHAINLEKLAEEFQYQKVPSALAKQMSVPIYICRKDRMDCKEIIFHNVQ